jgi:hypothetical protein
LLLGALGRGNGSEESQQERIEGLVREIGEVRLNKGSRLLEERPLSDEALGLVRVVLSFENEHHVSTTFRTTPC